MASIRRRPSVTLGVQPRQSGGGMGMPMQDSNVGPTQQDIQAQLAAQAQYQQQQQTPQAYAQRGSLMQQAQQAPAYQPGPNWPQNNAAPSPSWAVLDALKQAPAQAQQMQQSSDQASRMTLAASLGYKTSVPVNRGGTIYQEPPTDAKGNILIPSNSQLQTQFQQLPPWKQVQIYKQGGAPFLDQDDSGANLLQQQNDLQEGALKDQIGEIGKMVANGTMTFNPSDRKFYQVITDPDNPEAGLKKKVPISLLQAQLYKMGVERGMLPDADTLYKQQNGAPVVPQTTQGTSAQNTVPSAGMQPNIPPTSAGQPSQQFPNGPINFDNNTNLGPTATKVRNFVGAGDFPSDSNLQDANYNAILGLRNVPADLYNSGATVYDGLRNLGSFINETTSGEPSAPVVPSNRIIPYPMAGGYYHPTDIPGETGTATPNPWSVPNNPSQSGILSNYINANPNDPATVAQLVSRSYPNNNYSPKVPLPSGYPNSPNLNNPTYTTPVPAPQQAPWAGNYSQQVPLPSDFPDNPS